MATTYKEDKQTEEEQKLNDPMTRQEAFELRKVIAEHFGPNVSTVVMYVDNQWVVNVATKDVEHMNDPDHIMTIANKYMWDMIK